MDNAPSQGAAFRVPERTLRRLPSYYRYFQTLQDQGTAFVSCRVVGQALNLDPTLVRKDLESIAMTGRPRMGFPIAELVPGIGAILGYNGTTRACLAGAGSLGTALLGHRRFRQFGMQIVAAFDVAPSRVGTSLHEVPVKPLGHLPAYTKRHQVRLGIITVPAEQAQRVADLMVEGGISAIWSFAPARLRVPAGVMVQYEDLFNSLAALSHRLAVKVQGGVRAVI
jgi:redox-sensing transcriptional repressor